MQELHAALIALQEIDLELTRTEARVKEFDPQLQALEAPVAAIERELESTRAKLVELRAEQQRLEKNAQQKQERLESAQERLAGARNTREVGDFRAELDLVGSALDADRADIRMVSEQATRTDLRVDDLEKQLERAQKEIAEQRDLLLDARGAVETELAQLRERRENQAVRLDTPNRRLYERVSAGRSRQVLAPLTEEGACGNCFNILPLQEQADVRRGETLRRCEGCGVILYVE